MAWKKSALGALCERTAVVGTAPWAAFVTCGMALVLAACGGSSAAAPAAQNTRLVARSESAPPAASVQPAPIDPGIEVVCVGESTCVSPELKRRVESLSLDEFEGDMDAWSQHATWLLYAEVYDNAHLAAQVNATFVGPQRVRLEVIRGPRHRLLSITAEEIVAPGKQRTALGDPDALNRLAREGFTFPEWANRTKLSKRIAALRRYYQDAGYESADVRPVSTNGTQVDIKLEVVPGAKAYFREVRIVGLHHLDEKTVGLLLTFKAKQQYSASVLEASQKALLAHPCINQVPVSTTRDGKWVDVLFEIKETATCTSPTGFYFWGVHSPAPIVTTQLGHIGALFRIERSIATAPRKKRERIRKKQSKPIVSRFFSKRATSSGPLCSKTRPSMMACAIAEISAKACSVSSTTAASHYTTTSAN